MRQRKTDYGTIILHWLFVAAFVVALLSGLRIATETPDRTWINMLDVVLPRASVWTLHMQAAVVLVAVAVGYAVYLVRSGLARRVKLDKVRLSGLFRGGQTRLGALIAVMYWIFFVTMTMLLVSGGLLYFGLYSGYDVAMLHWVGTWVILAFVVLHVLTQYKSGGAAQLLRIFRPAPLPAPPPRLDAIELLGMLAEQSARGSQPQDVDQALPDAPSHPLQPRADARGERAREADPARRPGPGPARPRNPTLQANAFVVAAAAAITGAGFIVATDQLAVDRLRIARISTADAPALDGDTSDRAWRGVKPFSLLTGEGGNFDGKGETRITVRAVHDGTFAYFLFTWEDFDALAEASAAGQGSRRMAPASLRLSDRRRTSIQRRQVFGAVDDLGRHAGRRSHLPRRAAAGCERAGDHERPRPAFHWQRLCRCLAVEGNQRGRHRLDG